MMAGRKNGVMKVVNETKAVHAHEPVPSATREISL